MSKTIIDFSKDFNIANFGSVPFSTLVSTLWDVPPRRNCFSLCVGISVKDILFSITVS